MTEFQEGLQEGLRIAAEVARHFAELNYAAMLYPEEAGIAASSTASEIERIILASMPREAP